jgi:hypothetical protein
LSRKSVPKRIRRLSGIGTGRILFDAHVPELTGLKDCAAFFALDELFVIVAAYDLHTWMFARLLIRWGLRKRRRL